MVIALKERVGVDHAFLRTVSDDAFAEMCELLGDGIVTERPYGDHLEEFRQGVSPAS